MPFIQVDPKAIQFDAPQAPPTSNSFVKIDPSQIQFDKPTQQSPESGGRMDFIKQQWNRSLSGDLNPAEAGYNIVGKGIAGAATDAIGKVVSAVVPQAAKDMAGKGAQSVADFIDRHDPQTSDALLGISQAVPVLQKQYPRISNLADSTADILGFAPIAKAIPGAVGKAADMVASIPDIGTKLPGILGDTSSFMSPVSAINIPTMGGASLARKVGSSVGDIAGALRGGSDILSSSQLQDISRRGYGAADGAVDLVPVSDSNNILDKVTSHASRTDEGKAFAGDNIVDKTAADFENLRGKPLSIQGAMEVDSNLGDRIAEAKRSGQSNSVIRLQQMQNTFRNGIFNSGIEGAEGGQEGIQAWAAAMKMRDIERIEQVAASSDNPAKTMATQARNLLKSPLKSWGYRPEEIAALESASRTGILTDALRVAGSRLGPIAGGAAGFATGGLPGMAAASAGDYVASSLARSGAGALQGSRLNSVKRLIGNRPEIAEMTAPAGQGTAPLSQGPKLLPAPAPDIITDSSGATRLQTPVERDAAIAARQRADSIGMTPDIAAIQARNASRPLLEVAKDVVAAPVDLNLPGFFTPSNVAKLRNLNLNYAERVAAAQRYIATNSSRQAAFDALEKSAQEKYLADMANAPINGDLPIQNVVKSKLSALDNIKTAGGGTSDTAFSEALRRAMQMPPAQARAALRMLKP